MLLRTFGFFLFSYLFTVKIWAAVPADFMFHDKPIDALCFFNMEGTVIDLNQCGLAKEKYVMKGQNSKLIANGYIGYDWQDPEFSDSSQGYSYYKFFNAGERTYWLYTVNSGGGTGHFTAIHRVKRKNADILDLETLAGGDRCNGGLQDVSEVNNHLIFSQNLTAYDLVALSKGADPSVKAYDDLAACAICCVAKAYYNVDSNAQLKLDYIDLGTIADTKEMPDQGALQSCFNQLFISYVAAGNTKLKQNMLDEFAAKFNQTCKKSD
ncbi:hypothetical protein DGG96_05010 [Legionella qingyii]|uniref:Uncharacterized protein n=1 Tax=Legionella qingyii TaxID=2184757 RepID=A0A317U8P6_9GAMM|nr:hypothetical protein [Legionella qingyii]PWY56770.1 hypothetical protein DGG96_05010 [Legionella qingyii]RUR23674.1 hypothetical protein ELY20_06605 [Legionella qingyii]RUR26257.1 hypothetical protein ELY16_07465 [Legionella qingyii]